MTQGLIALVAFPEDLSFIASTHMAAYFCNSNPRESDGILTYIQEKNFIYFYIYIYPNFKKIGVFEIFF